MRSHAAPPSSKLVALLGPTNTGKTHRAIQRMLEHRTGMLGLPLRLLAREVYDRITRDVGEAAVALVTGEEKRIGARARYWVCTVEAMPMDHEVDFLAIDEVQLASHPSRGHVFTDRLLHARGREETWFLGADTMRPLLRTLLPTATLESHPRLSTLRARGQARLGAVPARSAVVAFNIPEVYRLAERLRHRRGGAAVVLGALSPRARNAQVALYESREVDYLVATDAIGMGLNLGIKHVAFASLHKFDGHDDRPLSPAELAQIAGRAGRHHEDGSFGTLAPLPPLPAALERSIEEHRFEPVRKLTWRNSDLCTRSISELMTSLRQKPDRGYFSRVPHGCDEQALERLELDADIRRRCRGEAAVQLLWQACQIPDYGKWTPGLHAELVKEIFLQLTSPAAVLTEDWLARAVTPLDDTSGDVDTLTGRIARVRTWTYVSNHAGWTENARYWVQRTRDIEDRLSDALHERLLERFVARRKPTLDLGHARPLRALETGADNVGAHHPFAVLEGLREQLAPEASLPSPERWVEQLVAAPHEHFRLDANGHVFAGAECLARLVRGGSLLRPEIKILASALDGGQRLRLSRRLFAWSRDVVHDLVGKLSRALQATSSPAARGLLYQLEQGLGSIPSARVTEQLRALTPLDRAALRELGVQLGDQVIYLPASLQAPRRTTRLALNQAFEPRDNAEPRVLMSRVSFELPAGLDAQWLSRVGFVVFGRRAVRADVLERCSGELRRLARSGPFRVPRALPQWLGCNRAEAEALTLALGYQQREDGSFQTGRRLRRARRSRNTARRRAERPIIAADPHETERR